MSIAHEQMSPLDDDDSPQHKDSADDSDDLNSGSPGGGQKELPYAALLDPSPTGGHNEVSAV